MKVRVVANKPESSDCSDISKYIGQVFECRRDWDDMVYIVPPDYGEIGLFPHEYEIVE